MKKSILLLSAFLFIILFSQAQQNNVVLYSEISPVSYFVGTSEPDENWSKRSFNDSEWKKDTISIIGHGYGDLGYVSINSNATSMYLRCPFSIENKDEISALNLMVDYDDGYIAYINGIEVARVNIDPNIEKPAFNDTTIRSHYSEFVLRLEDFSIAPDPVLGVFLDKSIIDSCVVDGENILAIQVIDDSLRTGLLVIPYLFDLTNIEFEIWGDLARHKRQVQIDSTNLPLIMIETDKYGIPFNVNSWAKAHMGIISNTSEKRNKTTDGFNVYDGAISIRTRGKSSHDFAKKSYRLELQDTSGKDTSVSLLGMPKENDWILFGPYTDKSQIRNKLSYDLGAQMGNYATRSRFCELVINGQNEGLYMLTEQIKRDKNRVDISKLDSTDIDGYDVTGGYIFKYDKFENGMIAIKKRQISYPNQLQPEQEAYLTDYFNTYDSVLMSNNFQDPHIGFRRYANDTSLVDYLIINEIAKNPDVYMYSTYMYKDRDDKDGRTHFGPIWDFDIAYGNTIYQHGNLTDGWQWEINKTMKLTRYLQDPILVELLQERWWEFRATTLSNDSIFSYFNQLIEEVREVRIRNYEVWPIIDKNLFGPGYYVDSYEAEIEYMSNWLETRLAWIDNNINDIYYKLEKVSVDKYESDYNLSIYPNPFDEQLRIAFSVETNSDVSIDLYNMMGQRKINHQIQNTFGLIDITFSEAELSNLKSGMYILKVSVNNQTAEIKKVIKR